jgi:hypothetical protein
MGLRPKVDPEAEDRDDEAGLRSRGLQSGFMARDHIAQTERELEQAAAAKLARSEAPTIPPPAPAPSAVTGAAADLEARREAPTEPPPARPSSPRVSVSGTYVVATESVSADLRRDPRRER